MSQAFVHTPSDAREVIEIVGAALRGAEPLEIRGGGSKAGVGAPRDCAILQTTELSGVVDYDPAELVLTARAGTALHELQQLVASEGQMLAFEPNDFGRITGEGGGRSTIGGVVASGLSGSRRISAGAARDHLLGFEAVSGRAERFVGGAKVVKNVTGYDLPKVAAGSWGRLFVLTELTLKVLPRGATRATVTLQGLSPAEAQAALAEAMGSQADVQAAAHMPAGLFEPAATTAVRLEGFAPSVAARATMIEALWGRRGAVRRLPDDVADAYWAGLADLSALGHDEPLWRINTPPSGGPGVVTALEALGARWLFDWAGGLTWLTFKGDPQIVRAAAAAGGGHAMLLRANEETRRTVPVFHPPAPGVAALEARVRSSFDPNGVFETGRFLEGVRAD